MSELAQAGILRPIPAFGRYLMFSLAEPAALPQALRRLGEAADVASGALVVGLGPQLVAALDRSLPGLHEFPALSAPGILVPSTPAALVCWLRGEAGDAGDLVHQTRRLQKLLAPALRLDQVVDAFRHGLGASGHGRDLTGYEDGTENPEGEAAVAAALVQGQGPGLDGSSFMALQQWRHDFEAFEAMGSAEQDATIGRRRSDNEELEDAPESAHVKRTAQEGFEPQAFLLRRSMPWAAGAEAGLMFVAFGRSLDAFEAQLRRMVGLDDGIADALFRISRPLSGAYAWCPPLRDGRLDLSALGL